MSKKEPSLEEHLLSTKKYRLSIRENKGPTENKKSTYRFHTKYRRLQLGLKIILIPVIIVLAFALIYRIVWFTSLMNDSMAPIFEIGYFEFVEELQQPDKFDQIKPNPHFYIALKMLNRTNVHVYFKPNLLRLVYNEEGVSSNRPKNKDITLLQIDKMEQVMYPKVDYKIYNKIGGPVKVSDKKINEMIKQNKLLITIEADIAFAGLLSRIEKKIDLELKFQVRESFTNFPIFVEKPDLSEPDLYEASNGDLPVKWNGTKYWYEFYVKQDWSIIDVILFPNAEGELTCIDEKDTKETIYITVVKVFIYRKDFGVIFKQTEDHLTKSQMNMLNSTTVALKSCHFKTTRCNLNSVYCKMLMNLGDIRII